MKLKNELIFICLILFILISITAVSSADNNTYVISDNNNVDDNILSKNDLNEETLSETGEGSFAELNKTVNGGTSSINLTKDYAYSSSDSITDGILINTDNFEIDGQGHTIDAKGQARIFYVNSTTVILKNIKFINGNANGKSGGAIYGYGDNLRIINCTFINNKGSWGGAVYSYPNSYSAIVNSTFIDNEAEYGGAMVLRGDSCHARHDVINCTFIANKASDEGGAILYYGDWDTNNYVRSCIFLNNTAPHAGAISNLINAMIDIGNSIFVGNSAYQIESFAYHVYANNNWWGNTADNKDAAPNVDEHIEVKNWLFFDAVANIESASATISINNLYDNATKETSIYETSKLPSIDVDLSAINATLSSNIATLGNSGRSSVGFHMSGDSTLTASYQGTSISKKYKSGSFAELQALIDNSTDGVISLDKDYVYTLGIDKTSSGIVISRSITIKGNGHIINAAGKSRVFYIQASDVTLEDVVISGGNLNHSAYGGAGVYSNSINTKFNNCTFINNVADSDGGAAIHLASHGKHTVINDCRFINNTEVYGIAGAIVIEEDNVTISNTLFENNNARSRGGAIAIKGEGLVLTNCTFKDNAADHGGAITDDNYGDIATSVIDCTFIHNVATTDAQMLGGGAIYARNMEIYNSLFRENNASMGSAIFAYHSSVDVDKCAFINNTGKSNGILFFAYGGNIINSIFLDNKLSLGSYVISTISQDVVTNYNWFGNVWKNYNTLYDVSNLCEMTTWLFLNLTDIVYDDASSTFSAKFTFFEYDKDNKEIMEYDYHNLPLFDLKLSSQNLTLEKDVVALNETINANVNYYKGVLIAQYENVKYEMPFKFKIATWIEVDSNITIHVKDKIDVGDLVHPFEPDYMIFLRNAQRITYTSNDTNIVKVDTKGKITGVNVGVATIFIRFNGLNVMGEDRYEPCNVTVTVHVVRIPTYIKVNIYPDSENLTLGSNHQFSCSVEPYSAPGGVTYTSNDTSVADVMAGLIIPRSEGKVNITVSYEGNKNYEPCSESFIFTITKLQSKIDAPTNLTINKGETYYTGISMDHSGILNYNTSDPNIVIVGENGEVTGVHGGYANITVSYAGNDKYAPVTVVIPVQVISYETFIDVNSTLEFDLTDQIDLRNYITLRDSDGNKISARPGDYSFMSNDTNVVRFDEYTLLHADNEGTALVTINFNGYELYEPSTANVTIVVAAVQTRIDVNSSIEMYYNQRQNLKATINVPELSKSLIYSSDNSSVVSVDSYGYIQAKGLGVAKITVKFNGTDKYLPATAEVIVTVVKAPTKIEVEKTFGLLLNDTVSLYARLTPISGATGLLVYRSNDKNVVTVDINGKIKAVGEGNATITISFAGNENYEPSNETVEVSVFRDSIPTEINVTDVINLYALNKTNIGAILTPANAGVLNYTVNCTDVISIDKNGIITALKEGKALINITLIPKDKYEPASASVLVIVSKIPTSIEADTSMTLNLTESKSLKYVFSHPKAGEVELIIGDDSIIDIANRVVTGKKVGKTNITISFKGNDQYAASNATVEVNVVDVTVSIIVVDSVSINVTESVGLDAKLDPAVAGSLVYTSSDESIITVNNKGVVKALKVGEADINVSFAGNGKYRANSTTVHVKVVDVPVSIDVVDSVSVNVTESVGLDAKLDPSVAGSLVYSSSDESVVTVNSNGVVRALKVGEADITVSFAGNGKYRANSTKVHVNVVDVKTEILVENDDIALHIDDNVNVNATLKPSEAGGLTYTSSNHEIVSIDEYGLMTALKEGSVTITIAYAGEGKYVSSNRTVAVKVSKVPTEIEIARNMTMEIGSAFTIYPKLKPSDSTGDLVYSSSDEDIVMVYQNGFINSISSGRAIITISYAGNEKYLPSNATIEVTVSARPTQIVVNDTIHIGYGDTQDIGAVLKSTYIDVTGATLLYESSDESIVSVDANGKITANKRGNALIFIRYDGQFSPGGDMIYTPSNATVNVIVEPMTTEITVNSNKFSLYVDENANVSAKLSRPSDGVLTYKSSNDAVAAVDANGKITALKQGDAIITISYAGNSDYQASSVNVTVNVKKISTTIKVNQTIRIHVDDTIDLNAVADMSNGKLTYKSSNEAVATVDANGHVNAVSSGSTQISINLEGDDKYAALQRTIVVYVSRIATSIKADPIEMYVGDEFTIKDVLTPSDAGKVTYDGYDWDLIDVDSKGVVTASREGQTEIVISYAGNYKYMPSNYTVPVTVNKIVIPPEDYKFTVTVRDELKQATFSVKLPEDIEGTFAISVDGKDNIYSEEIVNGYAKITLDNFKVGQHKVTMRYTGDEIHASITESDDFYIAQVKIDKNKDVSVLYTATGKYTVHLTKDTQAMPGKVVTFVLNGKKMTAKTNSKGYATIKVKLPYRAKAYSVSAQFGKIKVTNKVTVKSIVVAKNVAIKKSSKVTKIKVSLKKVNKKYLKGKKLTLKINGKKVTAKTNKKGVAIFKLKKSIYSKLKVGKKYKFTVTYLKNTVTKKATIKK